MEPSYNFDVSHFIGLMAAFLFAWRGLLGRERGGAGGGGDGGVGVCVCVGGGGG